MIKLLVLILLILGAFWLGRMSVIGAKEEKNEKQESLSQTKEYDSDIIDIEVVNEENDS